MEKNKKYLIILGTLVIVLIGAILIFKGVYEDIKAVNDKEIVLENIDEENHDREVPEGEPMHDEHFEEETTVFETDSNETKKLSGLILSNPVEINNDFYKDEWSFNLTGSNDGNTVYINSSGYDELIRYNIEEDNRKVLEQFVDYQYIDPVDSTIIYSKKVELSDDDGEKIVFSFKESEGRKIEIGKLDAGNHIKDGLIFKGVFIYTYGPMYNQAVKLGAFPIPGIYDESFYNTLQNNISGNTFNSITSDGNRLLVGSLEDGLVAELTDGNLTVLKEVGDFNYLQVLAVKNDTFLYYTVTGEFENAVFSILSNDGTMNEGFIITQGYLLDEDHFIYIDDNFTFSLYKISTGDVSHLDNDTERFFVSSNKIFIKSSGTLKYIEFNYE